MSEMPLEFIPRRVQFADVVEGRKYEATVTVRNTGSHLTSVHVKPPASKHFKLRGGEQKISLAPGLEARLRLSYSNDDGAKKEHFGSLEVRSGKETHKLRLGAWMPTSHITFEKVISFGTRTCDGSVMTQPLTVRNDGSLDGTVLFYYDGAEAIDFVPRDVDIPARSSVTVEVKLAALRPGIVKELVPVHVSDRGRENQELFCVANLLPGEVSIVDEESGDRTGDVSFPPTYYGAVRKKRVILRNWTSEPLDFVVLMSDKEGGDWKEASCVTAALKTQEAKHGKHVVPPVFGDVAGPAMQVIPSQGRVEAFNDILLTIVFSPVFLRTDKGWKHKCIAPPPRDFPCQLRIRSTAGSLYCGQGDRGDNLLVTGFAVPILMNVEPTGSMGDSFQRRKTKDGVNESSVHDFGACAVGAATEATFRVFNRSDCLALHLRVLRLAQFHCSPSAFAVAAGACTELTVAFSPRQLGTFDCALRFEVVDAAAETLGGGDGGKAGAKQQKPVIYELFSHVRGTAVPDVGDKTLKPFSGTLTGKWNPSKSNTESFGTAMETVAAAAGTSRAKGLAQENGPRQAERARLAHPNEVTLARSVRPHPPDDPVRFQYTGGTRHTYTDPDYSYTAEEAATKQLIRDRYNDMIVSEQSKKMKRTKKLQESARHNNVTDIGLKPGGGLTATDPAAKNANTMVDAGYRRPATGIAPAAAQLKLDNVREQCILAGKQVVDPEPKPVTKLIQKDCSRTLSNAERCNFTVTRKVIDLGQVDFDSELCEDVVIANGNKRSILFAATGNAAEFGSSVPWQAVVPPLSSCVFTITFRAKAIGSFYRDIHYSLNGVEERWIIVTADIVFSELHLSPEEITLSPVPGISEASGVSQFVTLSNGGNSAVSFTWHSSPEGLEEQEWSVNPRTGEVPGGSVLQCQVTCWGAHKRTAHTKFELTQNHSSVVRYLSCTATFEKTECAFAERRVQFGTVPFNLLCVEHCTLINKSDHHAYFEVDPPVLGGTQDNKRKTPGTDDAVEMSVTPRAGVVPAQGRIRLQVELTVREAGRMELSFKVALRGGGPALTMKVWAEVEAPMVRLTCDRWLFGNVFYGGVAEIPFSVENDGSCRALVTFDLTGRDELSLKICAPDIADSAMPRAFQHNKRYTFELPARSSYEAIVEMSPTSVANHDYEVTVEVNKMIDFPNSIKKKEGASKKPPRPEPKKKEGASKKPPRPEPKKKEKASEKEEQMKALMKPGCKSYVQPRCRVAASVKRSPLHITVYDDLNFTVPPMYPVERVWQYKVLGMENLSTIPQTWKITSRSSNRCDWPLEYGHVCIQCDSDSDYDSSYSVEGASMLHSMVYPGELKYYDMTFLTVDFEDLLKLPYGLSLRPSILDCRLRLQLTTDGMCTDKGYPQFTDIPIPARVAVREVKFQCTDIRLGPVPLGTRTSVAFSFETWNFKQPGVLAIKLAAKIGVHAQFDVLQLVDGSNDSQYSADNPPVGRRVSEVKVPAEDGRTFTLLISFVSKTPVSIAAVLCLQDVENYQKFEVPVLATADNSLLTVHSFLEQNAAFYDIYQPSIADVREEILRDVELAEKIKADRLAREAREATEATDSATESGKAEARKRERSQRAARDMMIKIPELSELMGARGDADDEDESCDSADSDGATSSDESADSEGEPSSGRTPVPATRADGDRATAAAAADGGGARNAHGGREQQVIDALSRVYSYETNDDYEARRNKQSAGEEEQEQAETPSDENAELERMREASLHTTGSSITLKIRDGYGYAVDDAETLAMVTSSVGNTLFTRTPSPYLDPQQQQPARSSPSVQPTGDTYLGKSWARAPTLDEPSRSGSESLDPSSGAAGSDKDHRKDTTARSDCSLVSDILEKEADKDTPFDSDPRKLMLEVIKLNPHGERPQSNGNLSTQRCVSCLERWLQVFGWPDGRRHMSLPEDFRAAYHVIVPAPAVKTTGKRAPQLPSPPRGPNLGDVLCHLVQGRVPNVPLDHPLPSDDRERALLLKMHYNNILDFLKTRGCLVSSIAAEDLLDFEEYSALKFHEREVLWKRDHWNEKTIAKASVPRVMFNFRDKVAELVRMKYFYEIASQDSWLALMLQIVKAFGGCMKISRKAVRASGAPALGMTDEQLPRVVDGMACSNVYSVSECNLLAWTSYVFNKHRRSVQSSQHACDDREIANRVISQFGDDFSDGLVFAVLLLAYAPFLAEGSLSRLFFNARHDEQKWHNAICVVEACQALCLDYYLEPQDIVYSHPVTTLLFLVHLFWRLPKYLPPHNKNILSVAGSLGTPARGELRLKNPTSRPAAFTVQLVGSFASNFSVDSAAASITIPARGSALVKVTYNCRFLRDIPCTLLAVSNTIGIKQQVHVHSIVGEVTFMQYQKRVECSVKCYDQKIVDIPVTNPFGRSAEFSVTVIEPQRIFPKSVKASTVQRQAMEANSLTPLSSGVSELFEGNHDVPLDSDSVLLPFVFCSRTKDIELLADDNTAAAVLKLEVIPLQPVSRLCTVVLSCDTLGDIAILVTATVGMPSPVSGASLDRMAELIPPPRRIHPTTTSTTSHPGDHLHAANTIFLHCSHEEGHVAERLAVSACNPARERAVSLRRGWVLSDFELRQRARYFPATTSSSASSSATTSSADNFYFTEVEALADNRLVFGISVNSDRAIVPGSMSLPYWQNSALAAAHSRSKKPSPLQTAPDVSFGRPEPGAALMMWQFSTGGVPGRYPMQMILWHTDDVRVVQLEVGVALPPMVMGSRVDVSAETASSAMHKLPLTNNDRQDWPLMARVEGRGFTGPSEFTVNALSDGFYPLTFSPLYLGEVEGSLTLTNVQDGVERRFRLHGEGTLPRPAKVLNLQCPVGKKVEFMVYLPNETDFDHTMQVDKAVKWFHGPDAVPVPSHSAVSVPMSCTTSKHGSYTHDITFTATPRSTKGRESTIGRREYQNFLDCFAPGPGAGNYVHIVRVHIKSVMKASSSVVKVVAPVGSRVTCSLKLIAGAADAKYRVVFDGDRSLSGPSEVTVPSGADVMYDAVFTPTALTGTTKSSVIFIPADLSTREVRYPIEATVTHVKPVQLPRMEAHLGSTSTCNVEVSNPIDEEIVLTPSSSNARNFKLNLNNVPSVTDEGDIILQAGESVDVPLTFVPTRMEGLMHGSVHFNCAQLGSMPFEVTGKPLGPAEQEAQVVRCPVFGSTCHKLAFAMPLEHDATAALQLVVEPVSEMPLQQRATCLIAHFNPQSLRCANDGGGGGSDDIELLFAAEPVALTPGQSLHVPVMFAPQAMVTRYGHLRVTLSTAETTTTTTTTTAQGKRRSVEWTYPLVFLPTFSLPEAAAAAAPTMLARVGVRTEQQFAMQLPVDLGAERLQPPATGAKQWPSQDVVPTRSMRVSLRSLARRRDDLEQTTRMLGNCCAVSIHNQASVGQHGGVQLSHDVIFVPSYEGWFNVALAVTHDTLGEWHMPLVLLATQHDYDGVVHMDLASLNQELSVVLELRSKTSSFADCQSFFAAGSHQGLSVRPQKAVLPPKGSIEGCMFEITFTPRVYRFPLDGVFIVKTADYQWIFKVEAKVIAPNTDGQAAHYTARGKPPADGQRNFLRENIGKF